MIKLKTSKSLLRYPGGKSRGAKQIFDFIPADVVRFSKMMGGKTKQKFRKKLWAKPEKT